MLFLETNAYVYDEMGCGTSMLSPKPPSRRRRAFSMLPSTMVVRPLHRWSDANPKQAARNLQLATQKWDAGLEEYYAHCARELQVCWRSRAML